MLSNTIRKLICFISVQTSYRTLQFVGSLIIFTQDVDTAISSTLYFSLLFSLDKVRCDCGDSLVLLI